MHLESLAVNQKLGRSEGIARQYGGLGAVYKTGGDAKKAKEFLGKALELFKKIGVKPEIDRTQRLIEELDKGGDS